MCDQITGGIDIVPLPQSFEQLGQGSVGGVPYTVLYAAAIGAAFWLVLERTRFGVNVRALGGNRAAAIGNGLLRTGSAFICPWTCDCVTAFRLAQGLVAASGSRGSNVVVPVMAVERRAGPHR